MLSADICRHCGERAVRQASAGRSMELQFVHGTYHAFTQNAPGLASLRSAAPVHAVLAQVVWLRCGLLLRQARFSMF